jgi:hypothetical protein
MRLRRRLTGGCCRRRRRPDPCAPPAVNAIGAVSLGDAVRFLYDGACPRQTGVDKTVFDDLRVATVPRERHEPDLDNLSAPDVLQVTWDDFMSAEIVDGKSSARIPNCDDRFHISHLGMSSFDAFDIVLVSKQDGSERCIWRNARSGEIAEQNLRAGEMEAVASVFSSEFRRLPG